MKVTTAACCSRRAGVRADDDGRAQVKEIPGERVTVSGTVEAIDHTSRVLTLKDEHGELDTIDVPAEAKRFSEIKVGDKITAKLLRQRHGPPQEAGRGAREQEPPPRPPGPARSRARRSPRSAR